MNWKQKAFIQNSISRLPHSLSNDFYYWVQRHFGTLKSPDFDTRLYGALTTCEYAKQFKDSLEGNVFFELGTGRMPIAPIIFWLCGAKKTITVDLNRYIKEELILEFLEYFRKNKSKIKSDSKGLFVDERLEKLNNLCNQKRLSLEGILDFFCIEYNAPADACDLSFLNTNLDIYTSHYVLEHIPPDILLKIYQEGNKHMNEDGIFIARTDYSDHFSHADTSISSIHFLKFSDKEWARYADNQYMYANRLRHDDLIELFTNAGHHILTEDLMVDTKVKSILQNGEIALDKRFSKKDPEILEVIQSWVVSQKK